MDPVAGNFVWWVLRSNNWIDVDILGFSLLNDDVDTGDGIWVGLGLGLDVGFTFGLDKDLGNGPKDWLVLGHFVWYGVRLVDSLTEGM